MNLDLDGLKPIYVQIADWLKNEILLGRFLCDTKVYSQYQLAELFNINPATAAKGLNILVDEGILYKKRGLGMFVATSAQEMILIKRKNETLKKLVEDLIQEAKTLAVSEEELIDHIKKSFRGNEA